MAKLYQFESAPRSPIMQDLRHCVSEAFDVLVRMAQTKDLETVADSLGLLQRSNPRLYKELMGCTLTNDIIQSICDELDQRAPQAQKGGAA